MNLFKKIKILYVLNIFNSLVKGGITRLLNTSIVLGKQKQDEALSIYMKKLQSSGYDSKTRLEILKSIKNGWTQILAKSENGERPLHRSRRYKKEERKEEKRKVTGIKERTKKALIINNPFLAPNNQDLLIT